MNTMRVDIINPKALDCLKTWRTGILLQFKTVQKTVLQVFLKKLRLKAKTAPTYDEITKEVELVRQKRYEKFLIL
jgi:hypothetical protein